LKIGIILSRPPTYSETFFISKIKGLQDKGFEVVLFTQKKDTNFSLCSVKNAPKVFHKNTVFQAIYSAIILIRFLTIPKRFIKFIKLERKENRTWSQILKNSYTNAHILFERVDWLHYGFTTMALQSENVAKAINAKMAISLRGFDIDVYPLKHKDCYNLVWKRVDKVHSISNYLLDKAKQQGLDKHANAQIITPAVAVENFKNINGNGAKQIHFISIARLHWIKGLNYTLEALALLKKQGVNFEFTIIGEGTSYEPLMFAIHQLDLQNEVNLIGKVPHNEIIGYLSRANIYLQYSNSEGFCNAVLEAQAIGLLCLVSNGGALAENIKHEKTGWIVKKRSPKDLAHTIKKVIELSDHEKNTIINQARERVFSEFNIEKQQQEFYTFYE